MIDARRMGTLAGRLVACSLLICFIIAGGGRTASAQQIEGAPTIELATFFVRGVDSAFDPNTNSFLVVGGAGPLVGVCVNGAGVPISGVFTINPEGFGAFPRASYSPLVLGGGGFLVTWAEETGAPSGIHGRTVNCAGAMGPEQVISSGHSAWLESGPAVAYSRSSGRFLVAWKSFPLASAPVRIKVVLVDNNGTPVSGVVDVSPGFGRDPGVTWNSTADHFGVSFSGETAADVKYVRLCDRSRLEPRCVLPTDMELHPRRSDHDHRRGLQLGHEPVPDDVVRVLVGCLCQGRGVRCGRQPARGGRRFGACRFVRCAVDRV